MQELQFKRRHEIDWLRILAFFILIFYYTGMPFIKSYWTIKNDELNTLLTVVWHFLHTWRIPLLFMISGMGVAFAFRKRSAREFFVERSRRLLIPLFFGVLVVVPPQIYVKLLFQGDSFNSYLDVYPAYFNGFDPPGNFSPSHLWFLVILYLFCLVALPLFLWFKTERGWSAMQTLHDLCEKRFGFLVSLVPIALGVYLLKPVSYNFWTDWATHYFHVCLFILGYITASKPELCSSMLRFRLQNLIISVTSFAAYFGLFYLERLKGIDFGLIDFTRILAVISLILAAFGYARHYLNKPSPFLTYTNEAVYPYYVLQPTIIIVLSFIAVQWSVAWYLKFAFVVIASFTSTSLIYHFLIRPFNPVRVLFGMKKKQI